MDKSIALEDIKIGVVGAGSWGTALADLLARKGYPIHLWVFEPEVKDHILKHRENKIFLPGVPLSPHIDPSTDLTEVVSHKDMLVIVVPSHVIRETTQNIAAAVSKDTIIVAASKGIENTTFLTVTGIFKETLAHISEDHFAVLSGPSFAKEVARQFPTVVTVASKNLELATRVQHIFVTPFFRVYTNNDVIGVELGGSVKNVIAVAAGIVDGLGLGLNARAALITRGQTEIRRLGLALGANPRTFTGLAGIGDLILTCTGNLSRNYTVGKKIGEGMKLAEVLADMQMVAEGVKTAKSVFNLSRKLGVEMPICQQVYHILYDDLPPKEAVYKLMTRDLKQELDEQ